MDRKRTARVLHGILGRKRIPTGVSEVIVHGRITRRPFLTEIRPSGGTMSA